MRSTRIAEWPTLLLVLGVHAAWLLTTMAAARSPWVGVLFGGAVVAWHGSLQHETIHGHPTRSARLNALLASVPVGLWMPYGIYRAQHIAHHRTPALTDPLDDPESFYVTRDAWARAGRLRRALLWMHATLVGRLILGPAIVVLRFFIAEARRVVSGDLSHVRAWAAHFGGVVLVVLWLELACGMSITQYVVTFVYPGVALTLLRSFAEHRPGTSDAERIGSVEAGPIASILYLNNNLHIAHHDEPAVPWYELPGRYRMKKDAHLARNGEVFTGYASIFRRFAVTPRRPPFHPTR